MQPETDPLPNTPLSDTPTATPLVPARRRSRIGRALRAVAGVLVIYLLIAYGVMPLDWMRYIKRHPALDEVPGITETATGIPGDPLNVGLVAVEDELQAAMHKAQWYPADKITFKSSLRIAADTVFHRPYDDAPVSSLYLWGRKQDLAFEQPVGDDPRKRHHVRFWRSEKVDAAGRPMWLGSVTFDIKVGLSHTTGEITHHIAPEVDEERDRLIDGLQHADTLTQVYYVDGFHKQLQGKNGGGDPYVTDGRLAVGVVKNSLALVPPPPAVRE